MLHCAILLLLSGSDMARTIHSTDAGVMFSIVHRRQVSSQKKSKQIAGMTRVFINLESSGHFGLAGWRGHALRGTGRTSSETRSWPYPAECDGLLNID